MGNKVRTSISIPKTLSDQAETLAQQLNISRNQLFAIAIADFIRSYETVDQDQQVTERRSIINLGDIYWVQIDNPSGSEPGIPHPHVIIQDNVLNHSRINTVVACALTSNIRRSSTPGNVLLDAGEANLPLQSVVEVSKVSTVDKTRLGSFIGSVSRQRIDQILAGMRLLQLSFSAR
jgi:mRNA interferase MazF